MSDDKKQIPQWLKSLQENSWELEILISGGAIFSLLQFSDIFIEWIKYIRILGALPAMNVLLLVGIFAIKVLTIGFILHLIFRAFWLALVCVNYVHPSGINNKKISWKKPFYIDEGATDLQKQIMKVDGYSGTIMFMSIISFVAVLGFLLLLFVCVAFHIFIGVTSLIILFIYLFDFITFGLLRKIPYLSYIAYPIFKAFDIISLRGIYQKPLLMQSTNVNKVTLFVKSLMFAFFSACLTYLSIYQTMHWPNLFDSREFKWQMTKMSLEDDNLMLHEGYYMDSWDDNTISFSGIDSKVQTSNLMEVFIAYGRKTDELINQLPVADSLKTYDQIVKVTVDDSLYNNIEWVSSKTQSGLFGITTMIPINNLKNGFHKVTIYTDYKSDNWTPDHGDKEFEIRIPFWVDK